MDKNKKQVIPRKSYRRQRREFFHNEEREERVEKQRQEERIQAKKDEYQAKVNEERVKDNLRKARIEKLTKEEIQQQQNQVSNHNDKSNKTQQAHENSKSKLTLPEEQQLKRDQNHKNQSSQDNNQDDNESSTLVQNQIDKLASKTFQEDHLKSGGESETKKNNSKAESSSNLNKQATYVKKHDFESENKHPYQSNQNAKQNQFETKKDNATSTRDKTENKTDYLDIIKSFFMEHWPKIAIIIGVILLIIILNAIFTNVNKNDHTNDSALTPTNKHYTDTMKSANSTVKSVVTVENEGSKNTSVPNNTSKADNEIGSGVVYKKVGDSLFIMTNAHVVGNKDKQKITFGNNKSVQGKVIGTDKWSDIAVIKAKSADDSVKAITTGNSNHLVLGEPIIVVGNPLGVDFKESVSDGIVSGLDRHVPVDIDKDDSYDVLMKAFQINAPVNPGNSGGAVVDRDGKLIGIVSLKIDMNNVEGMGFAIPINDAQKIANQLEKEGKVEYPNTGIKIKNVADIDDDERQSIKLPNSVKNGIIVGEVKPNAPGDKSGLKKDDVIVELDGKRIEDNLRYRQIIFSHREDKSTLKAKVYRDGKVINIDIKLK
ncbi:trypsin-like peptidase domain-containing protein [Staphylococcus warneri]|uniref:Serine protease HtrA-like n=4 Tax=Bacillati TaxID=1783272 RepID=A0A8B2ZNW7_STAWA|nr:MULTISPECIES: trypsin-like peptidase domain-containing protein [Staphylococcus]KKI61519.1 Serine protease [Staphylococcus warneri]MBF2177920.1 trypsin-like peptidase domain-containing protein [Staphylococcus warneri]MBF2181169.1 trypsin-like peptidase domain-containing protein [Staphylococcus warneri]MBF2185166.1 trypsin-like peptidase domain-containing protein [Staphylococcus warneri]MBF2263333.1 trypsin-like peptidase domain-containing protein [Staphylococcus warneri]